MSDQTPIEWTDHTFNAWRGCSKVSLGCKHCYAEMLDARQLRSRERHWGATAPRLFANDVYMAKPLAWDRAAARAGVRRRVFCMSMGDFFELHEHPRTAALQAEYRRRVFELIRKTPNLDWLLLTKRPENIQGMVPWLLCPANVMLGASIENQDAAEARLPILLDLALQFGARAFLSCEPLLGPLDLRAAAGHALASDMAKVLRWVIAGSESGARARLAELDWFRSLRDQCSELDIPYFFKQWTEAGERGQRRRVSLPVLDDRQHAELPAACSPEDVKQIELAVRSEA